MRLEFPYQIVTFLDREPQPGEAVYYGENGWYPQIALKRRFKLQDVDVSQLIQLLQPLADPRHKLKIRTGSPIKPEGMPVHVIDIQNQDELKSFHKKILTRLNGDIVSRYPDREDDNYYAHITVEHDGKFVINPDNYTHKEFTLKNIWILRDVGDENSLAYIKVK